MPEFSAVARLLIVVGALLVVLGLIISYTGRIPWLGRLPGDVLIRRGNFTFYAPLASMLVVSLLFSLLLKLLRR